VEAQEPEPFVPNVPEIKPLLHSFEDITNIDQMNALLLSLGGFLVQDKSKLSQWLQGI